MHPPLNVCSNNLVVKQMKHSFKEYMGFWVDQNQAKEDRCNNRIFKNKLVPYVKETRKVDGSIYTLYANKQDSNN